MDSCIDEALQVQTGRDISTKHLSFKNFFLSLHIFPYTRVLTKIQIEQRNSKRG